MQAQDFCYWLQGFFELSGDEGEFGSDQVQMVREHLKTVFNKVTPELTPGVEPWQPGTPLWPDTIKPIYNQSFDHLSRPITIC